MKTGLVFAQTSEEAVTVSELIVTGTIIEEKSVFETITRDSLTAKEIAVLQPVTVTNLLRRIPSLDVTQQGGEGGYTFISIRGGDPNFTVVMIDGVKVDDPTNSRGGGYDFAGLDPLMIESIDVYPGSYSAVYGSDSLGGTISVRTRGGSSDNSATVEAGTGDSWAGALNLSRAISDTINGSIALAARKGSDEVEGDSLDRYQLSLKLKNTLKSGTEPDWDLNFFYSNADSTAFPIASGGDQLAIIRHVEEREFEQLIGSGRLALSPTQNWQAKLALGWSRYEEHNDSPGIVTGVLSGVPPVLTDSQYERAYLTFSNTLFLTDAITVGLGAEYIHEDGEIDSIIDFGFPVSADFSRKRETWAVFGETAVDVGRNLSLVASLRHDDAENIDATNVRVAANLDVEASNTSLSISYGEGFKLPSLFALGHALTGNPNLVPERSESIALDIRQSLEPLNSQLSFRLYHNKFKNLVDFDVATFSHVNRTSATTEGFDLGLKSSITRKVDLGANVSYLHTEVSDGTRLERRPKWKGNFTISWRAKEKWLLMLDGHVNGRFYDVSVPTGTIKLDGYTDIDLGIQRKISDRVTLKFLVDNLLNSNYEEAVGFSTPGRQGRIAISIRL